MLIERFAAPKYQQRAAPAPAPGACQAHAVARAPHCSLATAFRHGGSYSGADGNMDAAGILPFTWLSLSEPEYSTWAIIDSAVMTWTPLKNSFNRTSLGEG
jgi:hypothetical protein